MKFLARAVLAALLCLCAPAAWTQDETLVTAADPMLLPKALLELRGAQIDRKQLQLVFDRTRDGEAEAPLTVWIGADYFAIVNGDRVSLTDLRLLRRFVIDRKASTLINLSLYGDVMLRRIELVRRMSIAAALLKEKDHPALPQSLDPFWIESELGIPGFGKLPAEMTPHQDGTTTQFLYGKAKVASVVPSDTAIPSDLTHSYGAFLRRTLPLHPSITRWLGEAGSVPKQLDYISESKGTTEKISLRLRSAIFTTADYPMPPHMSLVLLPQGENDPDVVLLRELLPRMTEAMSTRATVDGAARIADFRTAIDKDFKDSHKFAAALRLTELALRWGRAAAQCEPGQGNAPCRSKQEIDKLLRDDPRSVAMFRATAMQESQPAKAIDIWRGLDRRDVPNGYVVDIFLARLLSERGDRPGAAKSFAAAFAGNPAIIVLYRELGDHFTRVSRLDLAWLCYDFGRALPHRATPDALSSIDEIEQQLAETYPEMF